MRALRGLGRIGPAVCLVALGVFVLSVPLKGTPPGGFANTKQERGQASGRARGVTDDGKVLRFRVGPGLQKYANLPVLPPITVDYRKDASTEGWRVGGRVDIGRARAPAGTDEELAPIGTVAGVGCTFEYECDDCNPCTFDGCADHSCTGGPRDGFPCLLDADCRGVCIGGDDPGAPCASDLDCCGTSPTQNGTCDLFPCTALGSFQCVNAPIPVGEFIQGSECDDGLECNGEETCDAGACVPGTPLCAAQPELVCDEDSNACINPCLTDDECNTDGLDCTNDVCDFQTCVGGTNDGQPCRFDSDCPNGTCTGGGTGECIVGTPPCGPGGGCTEPNPPVRPNVGCDLGRCCDAAGTCSADTYPDCMTAGGTWLATNSACAEVTPGAGDINDCPVYGAGIAPQGDFLVEVGPFSNSTCHIDRLGDDYTADPTLLGGAEWIDVYFLRFAASVQSSIRFAVEFWDISGQTPIMIEDVFFPDGFNQGETGPAIFTVDFNPPLTIPASGVVAMSVQTNFGPDGAASLISTDAVDVGTNDAGQMFVNGAMVNDYLGQCTGGGRDGLWCDRSQPADPNVGCPGGTCDDIPDILAYELVAKVSGTGEPSGACCVSATGGCSIVVPWVCRAQGNIFQEIGQPCNFCSDDIFEQCVATPDCWNCVGGDNDGDPCPNGDPDCPNGTCDTTPICIPVPPACEVSACCDKVTGTCVEVTGGSCNGTVCTDDPFNTGCTTDLDCVSGTCVDVTGYNYQGNGTTCEPDCCHKEPLSGGDTCASAPVHVINIPALGEPPAVLTVTGSNVGATFNDVGDPNVTGDGTCEFGIFNPEGTTRDPGWWEAFSIGDPLGNGCAHIRIQLCCTDINGDPLRPAWGFLSNACNPCDTTLANEGVPPPIGEGYGTPGFARGGPFCNEDNLWQTFKDVPPGMYYYPIYSAPEGTAASPPGAQYQFTVEVGACPIAACCYNVCDNTGAPCSSNTDCGGGACVSTCDVLNEAQCDDLGGFWLAGLNIPSDADPIVTCDFNPCELGSCCFGPGDCTDRSDPNNPCDRNVPETCMDAGLCKIEGGSFVGGSLCDYPEAPCPVCTIPQDAAHCYSNNGGFIYSADRVNGGGRKIADDFIATGTTITQFCWRPGFLIPGTPPTECADPDGSPPPPPDQWEIRFYDDIGGAPGNLLHEFAPAAITAKKWDGEGWRTWQYSVVFDPPLTGFTPGERHWVELSGAGTPGGCRTYITSSEDGNGYSLWEFDLDSPWTIEDRNIFEQDFTYCISSGLAGTDEVTGACCQCDGTCDDNIRWQDCVGYFDPGTGNPLGTNIGQIHPNELCNIDFECIDQGTVGGCPGELGEPGEDCENPQVVSDGSYQFSIRCSSTDGRSRYASCDTENPDPDAGAWTIENDVWFSYTATCTGKVHVDLCGDNDFDGVAALFTNGTPECPDIRACPPDEAELVGGQCKDSFCGNAPDATFEPFGSMGTCYLLRIGGFKLASELEPSVGRGLLEISCETVLCPPSATPVTPTVVDEVTLAAGQNTATTGASVKNRFISVQGGDAGKNQVLRVRAVNLPPPYDIWNGMDFWVDSVTEKCENAGSVDQPCPPAAGLPKATFWAATLTCDVNNALKRDWTTLDLPIHIYNEVIVPKGTYEVAFAEENCSLTDDASYSDPPLTVTQAKWGDLVENCGKDPCGAPNGVVGVATDVTAVLDKFKNLPGAPIKARADLAGIPPNDGELDLKIQIIDVTWCLNAFVGGQYGFDPGDPCDGAVAMK